MFCGSRSSIKQVGYTATKTKLRLLVTSTAVQTHRPQVLFLSPVWPERSSSAAGVRTADLVQSFQNWGFDVIYSSPSKPNAHAKLLESVGVQVFQCAPNREEELKCIISKLLPSICVFDRFYAEEAFSFRVRELAPNSMRVLDMQDVHFLRSGRQDLARSQATMQQVMSYVPSTKSAECLRELSAIHRSDLTLVCSPVELELLVGHYGIPRSKLALAPFFAPPSPFAPASSSSQLSIQTHLQNSQCSTEHTDWKVPEQQPVSKQLQQAGIGHETSPQLTEGLEESSVGRLPLQSMHGQRRCPSFLERSNFMMIGNFRHPPNMDSVEWACKEVWPQLRHRLAGSSTCTEQPELHIYGSYPSGAAQRLHNPKEGVHLKGFAPSLDVMLNYRVSLAPLRFGAGLKGKVVDSWWHGLPVCTTPVGAEGMLGAEQQGSNPHANQQSSASRGEDSVYTVCRWPSSSSIDGEQLVVGAEHEQVASGENGFVRQMGAQHSLRLDDGGDWGGMWQAETAEELAAAAAELYTQQEMWAACQTRGFQLLEELYGREANLSRVQDAVLGTLGQLEQRRLVDFTGQLLWQQQFRATEFMSRWIELKEKHSISR